MAEAPLINFDWSPSAGPVGFTLDGDTFPPTDDARYAAKETPPATVITFTAQAVASPGQKFVYFEWDFGDGRHGRGQSVTHSYPFFTPEAQVTLRVTDTRHRVYIVDKMINIHAAVVAGGLDPAKLDPLNYILADPSEDNVPSVLDAVGGALQLRARTQRQLGEVQLDSHLTLTGDVIESPPAHITYDPAHVHGSGSSDLATLSYAGSDYQGLQLHSAAAVEYLQWDDRFTRTNLKQWDVKVGNLHSLGFADADLIVFGGMDDATGERLQARLFNDSGANTINVFFEKVSAAGAVTVLGSSSMAWAGFFGQGVGLSKRGKFATAYVTNPSRTVSITLSDADATRFETGKFGWGWNGNLGTDDSQNWPLDFFVLTDIFPEHFEYTYGQIYTPSLDTPPGSNVMVWQKFIMDDTLNPGTLEKIDMRYNPQVGGLLAKWRDARTGGGHVALAAPTVIDSTAIPNPLDIGDTTGFPATGTVIIYEPYPSQRVMLVDYTGKTGTTLTGTSLNDTLPQDDTAAPWSTGTMIRPLPNVSQIGGVFTYVDIYSGGLGILTDWMGSTWDALNDPDELFLEVGVTREWTTLAADWHYDGTPFAAQENVVVTDPSRVPSNYNGALIFEGAASTLYDTDGHPYESGQGAVYVSWTAKTGSTLTGVQSHADTSPPSRAGLAHVFPAGTKIALSQWNIPLVDGVSIPGHQGYGNNSQVFFDNGYTLSANAPISGFPGALRALTPYWTVLRIVGNEVKWEFWESDPFVGGNTYKVRLRMVINDATRITRFGAAASGGVGIMGYTQPYPVTKTLDWGYQTL